MKQLFGGILLGIGLLIALLSGACSVLVIISGLSSGGVGALSGAPIVLIFGGIPFVIGAALFLTGRAMLRSAKPPEGSLGEGE